MDFRPAYRALKDRLEADLSDVVFTVTRKNLPAKAFAPENQPALVILELGDDPYPDPDNPFAWELHALLVLHLRVGGEDEAPGDAVLELRDRVERALMYQPQPDGPPRREPRSDDGYWTTLGGAVLRARLESVSIDDAIGDAAQVSQLFQVSMLVTPSAA